MDVLFRTGYRLAHRLLRGWWFVRRPQGRAAAVAVWHDGRLLVVRTSYRPEFDLPGGGVAPGETPLAAAERELREETGLHTASAPLADAGIYRYPHEHRRITAHVFAWWPADLPQPSVDNREIVWAGYLSPAELRRAPASALLRHYLDAAASAQPCSGTRQISRA
jgi:8-oxo-dGTP pyrophosphatase MutT (NUDIX family)